MKKGNDKNAMGKDMSDDEMLKLALSEGICVLTSSDKSMKGKLKYAWLLLCYPKAISGDIEVIKKNGETISCASVEDLPASFDEFMELTKDAKAFHARIGIPADDNSPAEYMPAIISSEYNFVFDLLLGGNYNGVLFHATMVPEDIRDDLKQYILDLYDLAAEVVPPEKTNPEILVNKAALRIEKHSLHATIADMPELNFGCNRSSFGFMCLENIPCCGVCPMLKESYSILINDVLDPESANELKELVEKAGILTGEMCSGCKGDACPGDKRKVVNYINYLWEKAFL